MANLLTLAEIKQQYHDEWLLIAYTALDENLNVIQGEVLKHSSDADDIYEALPQYGDRAVAIEYVGELPKNVAFIL
jgi:hypothetical protein